MIDGWIIWLVCVSWVCLTVWVFYFFNFFFWFFLGGICPGYCQEAGLEEWGPALWYLYPLGWAPSSPWGANILCCVGPSPLSKGWRESHVCGLLSSTEKTLHGSFSLPSAFTTSIASLRTGLWAQHWALPSLLHSIDATHKSPEMWASHWLPTPRSRSSYCFMGDSHSPPHFLCLGQAFAMYKKKPSHLLIRAVAQK